MTLHAQILAARNRLNLERYKVKRRADYFQLAGLPDHRTPEERKAYRAMMARRAYCNSGTTARILAAWLSKEHAHD